MDTLSRDDAEVRRRLSDLTRRITVYRVNEKALTRRYQTMEETDGQLRKVREREVSEYIGPYGSAVVECLTRDRGAAGSSLTGVTALCP